MSKRWEGKTKYMSRDIIVSKGGTKYHRYIYENGKKAYSKYTGKTVPTKIKTPIHELTAPSVIGRIVDILQSKQVENFTTTESEILAHLAAAGYVKLTIEKI